MRIRPINPDLVCPECDGHGGWRYQINGHYATGPDDEWITCERCQGTGYLLHYRAVRHYKLHRVAA
jgi:DnaJ-class molecular chaperone